MTKTLMDSGPLVAYFNRTDKLHNWANEVFQTLYGEIFTTEPVITETVYFLKKYGGNYAALMDLLAQNILKIEFRLDASAKEIAHLMQRYSPRMDLADATLVLCAQNLIAGGEIQVVTVDRQDFSVYRILGRQTIPIIAPEA